MKSILSAKSDRSFGKHQQRTRLCEGIKALAVELLEAFQNKDHVQAEVGTIISAMRNRLSLLKGMIEVKDLPAEGESLKLDAQQFIAEHSAETLNLKNFSKFLGYSPKYCSRLFKARTGVTFSHYTTKLRIDMATHMLLETSQSVSVIAELVGFSDPFIFSHFFKRAVGCSPMKFRAAKTNGQEGFSILQSKAKPSTKQRKASRYTLESAVGTTNSESAMQVG